MNRNSFRIINILLLCIPSLLVYAQAPQKIYPYNVQQHTMEWYHQQAKAWENVTSKHPGDATAWYNLYYAHRLINFHDTSDQRTQTQKQEDMERLLRNMEKHIGGTYEFNLIKWAAGGLDLKNLSYLLKADELGKGRTEHLTHMMNITEVQENIPSRDKYAKQMYDAGEVSPGMLYYNYNMLMGLDSNAILLTAGDNDTYPAWVLQSLGIRRDVRVLNISLLLIDDYRKQVTKTLQAENITIDWNNSDSVEYNFYRDMACSLISNGKNYPFYISFTASYIIDMIKPAIKDKLYITGVVYRFSDKPVDNMAVLRKNFEQVYSLDYIDKAFYIDKSAGLVNRINANYIVPMIKLYDHYKMAGDFQRQQWIKEKLLTVSRGSEDEKNVLAHLAQY